MIYGKFTKKPVTIEAYEIVPKKDVHNRHILQSWLYDKVKMIPEKIPVTIHTSEDYIEIETLEGIMVGNVGDFIICGVEGELYPCKPDIFRKTYNEEIL